MEKALEDMERKVIAGIWSSDESYQNLLSLCRFGSRFGGTKGEKEARDFILKKFREYGLDAPYLEEFEYRGWMRGTTGFEITHPIRVKLDAISLPYCPTSEVETEIVSIGDGVLENFKSREEMIPGKIVLVEKGPKVEWSNTAPYGRAVKMGAYGFILMRTQLGQLKPTGTVRYNQAGEIPAVGISYESGHLIKRLLKKGNVKAKITTKNKIKTLKSWNVIGDIKGSEQQEEKIIVGGHYDGHDIAQGAVDNASGICILLESARALAKHKGSFKRTIRFICFPVEEIGLIGSYAYRNIHRDEMEETKFMLNLDGVGMVGGAKPGIGVQGFTELIPFFKDLIRDMKLPYEALVTNQMGIYSDHLPFLLQGVMTGRLVASDPSLLKHLEYVRLRMGHTAADTVDKVDPEYLKMTVIMASRLIARVANAVKIPVKRKTREEVKQLIRARGFEEPLVVGMNRSIDHLIDRGVF